MSETVSAGPYWRERRLVVDRAWGEARHRLQGHAKTYVETLEAYTTYMVSICPGSVNGDTVRPWRASLLSELTMR